MTGIFLTSRRNPDIHLIINYNDSKEFYSLVRKSSVAFDGIITNNIWGNNLDTKKILVIINE